MKTIRVSDGRLDAIERLLRGLPAGGMSAPALAKIGRMRLDIVEEALARLAAAGAVTSGTILKDGKVIELWRRL